MTTQTRRETIATAAGTVAVTLPFSATVTSAQTDSGFVEVDVDATIPTDTSAEITAYEDESGDGVSDRNQTVSIDDGDNTYEYDDLLGYRDQGIEYWFDLSLQTEDVDNTPEIHSLTITLPEDQPTGEPEGPGGETQGLSGLWDNFLVFVTIAVMAAGALGGIGSRSMAIGAFSAYMVFAYIAVETGASLLTNILYVTLVLIFVGFAFKLWRLEGSGDV